MPQKTKLCCYVLFMSYKMGVFKLMAARGEGKGKEIKHKLPI